jgi:profilin
MGGTNIGAYAVRLANVMQHLRTGDEEQVRALTTLLGSELDAAGEEWAREGYGLTPREALRHLVMGVTGDGIDIEADYAHDVLYIMLFELLVRHYGEPLGGWDSMQFGWFGQADAALARAGIDFSLSSLICQGISKVPSQSYDSAAGCLVYDEIPEVYAVLAGLRRGDVPLGIMRYVAVGRDWSKRCLDQHRDLVCIAGDRPLGPRPRPRRRLFPSERPSGSWQQHVDERLIADGPFRHAAIFGLDGRQWAASTGFEVTAAEFAALTALLAAPTAGPAGSVRIAGRAYAVESPERGRLTGADRVCRLTVQRTGRAVFLLLETIRTPDTAAELEEQLIDFLDTFG